MSTDLHLHLPDLLSAQLVAAHEAGYYDSEEELVAEAVRTFLAARPDVRVAAALAGLNSVSMKQALHERGISRVAPESLAETETLARAALRSSGRSA